MKRYVDCYLLPLKKRQLDQYKKLANKAGRVWLKHGALQYVECLGEDMDAAQEFGGLSFSGLVNSKPDETVVVSFITYRSRSHRDKVNRLVQNDPVMLAECGKSMPFDLKRMAFGGFETLVNKGA